MGDLRARVPDDIEEWVERRAEETDETKSAVLRQAIRTYRERAGAEDPVGDDEGDTKGEPSDRELRAAYRELKKNANPKTGGLDAQKALTVVAERMKTPKEHVRAAYLDDLDREGYIIVRAGSLWVYGAAGRSTEYEWSVETHTFAEILETRDTETLAEKYERLEGEAITDEEAEEMRALRRRRRAQRVRERAERGADEVAADGCGRVGVEVGGPVSEVEVSD